MAKGNMLQGMARGKVGDVVFSRLNGQQISRVRNRQPYNPRTNKQLIQRAIMAQVMLAYSAGKEIFNHSFQGKSVGSGCQREFMRLNAKYLRGIIANDLNNNVALASQQGRVVAPGATAPVASPLIIADGSYVNNIITWSDYYKTFQISSPNDNETCKAFCERVGLIPGDIYTFIGLNFEQATAPASLEAALKTTIPASFYFVRIEVKENALNDNTAMTGNLAAATATNGVPCVVTDQKTNMAVSSLPIGENGEIDKIYLGFGTYGAYGVIRSRKDQDLRSHAELKNTFNAESLVTVSGLASQFITDVWGAGAVSVGDSDLILEGGDI